MSNPFKEGDKVITHLKGGEVKGTVRTTWNHEVQIRIPDDLIWRTMKKVRLADIGTASEPTSPLAPVSQEVGPVFESAPAPEAATVAPVVAEAVPQLVQAPVEVLVWQEGDGEAGDDVEAQGVEEEIVVQSPENPSALPTAAPHPSGKPQRVRAKGRGSKAARKRR